MEQIITESKTTKTKFAVFFKLELAYLMQHAPGAVVHFVELVDAAHAVVRQNECTRLQDQLLGFRFTSHGCGQTHCRSTLRLRYFKHLNKFQNFSKNGRIFNRHSTRIIPKHIPDNRIEQQNSSFRNVRRQSGVENSLLFTWNNTSINPIFEKKIATKKRYQEAFYKSWSTCSTVAERFPSPPRFCTAKRRNSRVGSGFLEIIWFFSQ